jgi:hypothetical protein
VRLGRPRDAWRPGEPGPSAAFAARPKDLWRTPRTGCRPGRSRPRSPPCSTPFPRRRDGLPHLLRSGPSAPSPKGGATSAAKRPGRLWIAEPCCLPRSRAVSRARRLDRFCPRRVPREHDRTRSSRSPSRTLPSAWQAPSSIGRAAQASVPEHLTLADRPSPRALASFPPVPLRRFEGGRGREWTGRAPHRRHRVSRAAETARNDARVASGDQAPSRRFRRREEREPRGPVGHAPPRRGGRGPPRERSGPEVLSAMGRSARAAPGAGITDARVPLSPLLS